MFINKEARTRAEPQRGLAAVEMEMLWRGLMGEDMEASLPALHLSGRSNRSAHGEVRSGDEHQLCSLLDLLLSLLDRF